MSMSYVETPGALECLRLAKHYSHSLRVAAADSLMGYYD